MSYGASDRTVGEREEEQIGNKAIWTRHNGESKEKKKKSKNIIVAGIKEKPVENVLLSILRISGP